VTNRLKISVEPSFETNDHQARLLVDGDDWLGDDHLGLDPPLLKKQLRNSEGELILGRCWCGCVGCDDVSVEIVRTAETVTWKNPDGRNRVFETDDYDAELLRFENDTSWEPVNREVEREVECLFAGSTIRGGYEFEWASTRIEKGFVKLSFSKGHRQKFLKFAWDGVSATNAVEQAKTFRSERFSHMKLDR